MTTLTEVKSWLGEGWEMRWAPPPRGVSLLKEFHMADPAEVEPLCRRGEAVVVYIVASVEDLNVIYGRVKPRVTSCPTATFIRRFRWGEAAEAVKTLVEFALKVDKVPLFQINPEVVRYAGLCGEYPLLCEEPDVVVEALRRRLGRRGNTQVIQPRGDGWALDELVKVLREKIELDAAFAEVVKKVAEDPERLRMCYA